jgi:glycine hydroxymethyltransferase
VTTRGFTEAESELVADLIADVLDAPDDEAMRERTAEQVRELMRGFPLPGLSRVA